MTLKSKSVGFRAKPNELIFLEKEVERLCSETGLKVIPSDVIRLAFNKYMEDRAAEIAKIAVVHSEKQKP